MLAEEAKPEASSYRPTGPVGIAVRRGIAWPRQSANPRWLAQQTRQVDTGCHNPPRYALPSGSGSMPLDSRRGTPVRRCSSRRSCGEPAQRQLAGSRMGTQSLGSTRERVAANPACWKSSEVTEPCRLPARWRDERLFDVPVSDDRECVRPSACRRAYGLEPPGLAALRGHTPVGKSPPLAARCTWSGGFEAECWFSRMTSSILSDVERAALGRQLPSWGRYGT